MLIGITGIAGSIGSVLRLQLEQQGFFVKGIDNRYPSHDCFYGDIKDPLAVQRFVQDCDGIIHLAAISRVAMAEASPQETFAVNTKATYTLAQCARDANQKPWFVFASSKEVYGDQLVSCYQEELPLEPKSVYGKSKKAAEYILNQKELECLPKAILRFSNVYGSWVDYRDRLVPSLILSTLQNKNIVLYGKDRLFDLVHVCDVVAAILQLIEKLSCHRDSFLPININYGKSYSLKKIAHTVVELAKFAIPSFLPQPANILTTEHSKNDLHKYQGSIHRAEQLLQWKPKVNITQGLHRTMALYAKENSLALAKKEMI